MARADRPTLVHPVYLDTPMLMSFVATLEDGVSLGAAVTESSGKTKSTDLSGSGEGGTDSVLALLGVKLTATGELSRSTETDKSVQQTFTRQHTLASLFSRLVQGLTVAKAVKINPTVEKVQTGDLVIFDARIEENPLEVALTTTHGLLPLIKQAQADPSLTEPEPQATPPNRAQRRHPEHPNNTPAAENEAEDENDGGFDLDWIESLIDVLRSEQESSAVIDLVGHGTGFSSIITADRGFFSNSSRAAILDGEFKVLGKVTAVVSDPDASVSLIRRGASARVEGMFAAIAEMLSAFEDSFARPLPPSQISGPLLQVLPVAIYI